MMVVSDDLTTRALLLLPVVTDAIIKKYKKRARNL